MLAGPERQGLGDPQEPLPRVPPWKLLRRWPKWLLVAGLLGAAAATNPSYHDLMASVTSQATGKLGFWTGPLTPAGLRTVLHCLQPGGSQDMLPDTC